jgi:hypothetical protein
VEFVTWLGTGRKLTQTGQLTLADARTLVPMLRTGDRVDPVVYGKTARTASSRELAGLSLVFSWVKAARLVRVVGGRAVPVAKHGKLLHDEGRLFAALLAALPCLGDELAPQGGWFSSPAGADFPAAARLVLDELSAEAAALPAGEGPVPWSVDTPMLGSHVIHRKGQECDARRSTPRSSGVTRSCW